MAYVCWRLFELRMFVVLPFFSGAEKLSINLTVRLVTNRKGYRN